MRRLTDELPGRAGDVARRLRSLLLPAFLVIAAACGPEPEPECLEPPIAAAVAEPAEVMAGDSIVLSAAGLVDPCGAVMVYTWRMVAAPGDIDIDLISFPGNGTAAGEEQLAVFDMPGTYEFEVDVSNAAGVDVAETRVVVRGERGRVVSGTRRSVPTNR